MEELTLSEKLASANNIYVIKNNYKQIVNKTEFLKEFNNLTEKSYFSPALGVAIHELTKEEVKKGLWLQFEYDEVTSFADLPFKELWIEILPDFYGFNIIRKFNNKYDGRCLYINLNKNSTTFYNYLQQNFS